MRIKQNPLIRGIIALMVVVPVGAVIYNSSHTEDVKATDTNNGNSEGKKQLTTKSEEIAALSGYVSQVETELKGLKQQSSISSADVQKIVKAAIEKSSVGKTNIDQKELMAELSKLVDTKTEALKQGLEDTAAVSPNRVGDADNEIPFSDTFEINGQHNHTSTNSNGTSTQGQLVADDKVQWSYPVGYVPDDKKDAVSGLMGTFTDFGKAAGNSVETASLSGKKMAVEAKAKLQQELKPIPYATIHADSSIFGATALTALIGRIEKDGATHDPYKFQIMLSGDTLMANGQTMPGVANAIISGQASGDQAFSCVRGRITSITFNFSDGRIYNQRGTFEEPLAYVGDEWGNPCVSGKEVSNIKSYLAAQGFASGLSSAAEGIAKAQSTVSSSSGTTTTSTTGSMGKMALGSFGSGTLDAASKAVEDYYESYYQAVYVAPGAKVSVLFDQDINIDYVPTNRKVSYATNFSRITSLD